MRASPALVALTFITSCTMNAGGPAELPDDPAGDGGSLDAAVAEAALEAHAWAFLPPGLVRGDQDVSLPAAAPAVEAASVEEDDADGEQAALPRPEVPRRLADARVHAEWSETIPGGLKYTRVAGSRGGIRVGLSADGRDASVVQDGGASVATLHGGELLPGERLLPVLDLSPYEDSWVVFGPQGAWLLGYDGPAPLDFEPALRPRALTDRVARERTVFLRWFQSCPTSREPCAVYGAPDDVGRSVDPVAPPHGWFLRKVAPVHVDPDRARHLRRVTAGGVSLELEGHELSAEDSDTVVRALLVAPDGRRIPSIAFATYDGEPTTNIGVTHSHGRLLVWAWDQELTRLTVAEHGPESLARLSGPVTVQAETYEEVDCANIYYGTRPTPVRRPDGGLGFALYWGGDKALYFAEPGEDGELLSARTAGAEGFEYTDDMDTAPQVFRLRAGRLVAGR